MSAREETLRVKNAIRLRHSDAEGEWLVLDEFDFIDAFVIRCFEGGYPATGRRAGGWWPRRFHRISYEVKVSRQDFRREIARPQKRAKAVAMAHEFYFICPAGLIQPHEVPTDCGLVWVRDDNTSRVKVRAPVTDPEPLTIRQVVGLLRMEKNPAELRAWKLKARDAQKEIDAHEHIRRRAEADLEQCQTALEFYARALLVEGSEWIGTWQRWRSDPPEPNVRVVIEDTYGGDLGRLRVQRLDREGWEGRTTEVAAEFLTRYRPALHDNQDMTVA